MNLPSGLREFGSSFGELGEWHALHVKGSDLAGHAALLNSGEEAKKDEHDLVEYTVLSHWRKRKSERVTFDLYVTDGEHAYTGKDLQRPEGSTHEKWNERAFQALTRMTDGLQLVAKVTETTTTGAALELRWTWEEEVMQAKVRVKAWLEHGLERCDRYEAPGVIRFMFSKLVDCNRLMVDLSKEAEQSLQCLRSSHQEGQRRFSEYRSQEQERTKDVLLKCTDILNKNNYNYAKNEKEEDRKHQIGQASIKKRRKIV
jgi:hypothetical protein